MMEYIMSAAVLIASTAVTWSSKKVLDLIDEYQDKIEQNEDRSIENREILAGDPDMPMDSVIDQLRQIRQEDRT